MHNCSRVLRHTTKSPHLCDAVMGLILPECIILHTQIPSTVILHTFSDFVDVFATAEQSGLFLTEPDACNSLACPTKTLWRPFIAKFGPVNCRCHFYGGCALHCSLADWFSCVNIAAIHNEHLQKLQCYRVSRLVQNREMRCWAVWRCVAFFCNSSAFSDLHRCHLRNWCIACQQHSYTVVIQ